MTSGTARRPSLSASLFGPASAPPVIAFAILLCASCSVSPGPAVSAVRADLVSTASVAPSSSNGTVGLRLTGIDSEDMSFQTNTDLVLCGPIWSLMYTTALPVFTSWAVVDENVSELNWSAWGQPGTTTWWFASVENGCTSATYNSSTIEVTEPPLPALTWSLPTPINVTLNWTNPATYGGLLSFESYEVTDSVQGGTWTELANMTDLESRTFSLSDLETDTLYQFQVATWDDRCTPCTGGNFNVSVESNATFFTTAPAFAVRATASHTIVDAGQSVDFTCYASGGSYSYAYTWNFGDGTTAMGPNVTHAYAQTGQRVASCTVEDSGSQTLTSEVPITIGPALVVSFTESDDRASPGTPITFRSVESGGSGSYLSCSWSFGDGVTASGVNASHAYGQPGIFNVSLSVEDSNGAVTVATGVVNVSSLSVIGRPSVTSASVGESVTFGATAAGGGGAPYTFTWVFGDGSTATGMSVSHSYAAAGSYVVRVSVVDAQGGVNGSTVATITVGPAGASGAGARLFGLPAYVYPAAAVAIVAIAVAALLVRRRRGVSGVAPPGGNREGQ